MNKQLFFLLTSCAVVAFAGIANAIEVNVDDKIIGSYEDWQKALGEQYKNLTPEQLHQLSNKTYTLDETGNLIQAGQDAVSKEFQEQVSQLGNAISDSSSNIMGKAQ